MSTGIWVNGVVAHSDKQPYVQLSNENGIVCQLSMAEARNVAMDILQMCARTEADAMILKFFSKEGYPEMAGAALMAEFRDFRGALDQEQVDRRMQDPDTGEEKL